MLSPNVEKALNDQICHELYSSYVYLSMAAYCHEQNYSGFASWLQTQSAEEYGHAMKLYGYIHQRGGKVTLQTIEAPKAEWSDLKALMNEAYEHEKKMTSYIDELVNKATQANDQATASFLQWYVDEQVEEEASTRKIVARLEQIGQAPQAMFMLDGQMAMRQQQH